MGEALLFNALRCGCDVRMQHIASMATIVDPLHDRAHAFYERYSFQRFTELIAWAG